MWHRMSNGGVYKTDEPIGRVNGYRRKDMKKLIAVIIVLALSLVPLSCAKKLPSAEDAESYIKKNWKDIALVNDYLLKLGNKDYIALIKRIKYIENWEKNENVYRAILSLESEGCYIISKRIEDNAIYYGIWKSVLGKASCGFLYAIDHTRPPKLQYQTELIPLSREGWYYYIENYEEWRENNRPSR